MAEFTGTITTDDGAVLHYETIGQPSPTRPSLVFHHYYGGSPLTYKYVLSQACLDGYHKILYHARGWFPSTGPKPSTLAPSQNAKAYGIEALSSDLEAIISATGLRDHRAGFVIIGHSMGGKVAQHYAASTPSPGLKGLILVAPAPLHGLKFPEDAKKQQLEAYKSASNVRFVVENVLTAGPGSLSDEDLQQCVHDSMRSNEEAAAAWPEYACEENFGELEEGLTNGKVPVLVLRGDKDFERDLVGDMGTAKGWVARTVRDCGHLIPLERPEILSDEIAKFVEGL
jgi:pimeloyl-ACP methyl ester carboxylesterase